MSPDIYLGFIALFINYFLKVAVACLLCWVLALLLRTPRQRFTVWLGFVLGSLAYWFYAVTTFSLSAFSAADGDAGVHSVARTQHQFLVPARFQYSIMISGRILGGAYILVVVLLVMLGAWKRIRLRSLLRPATPPSAGLQHLFSEMSRHFGVRHCDLLVVSQVNSPATVYWWRPRVVLPQACEQMGDTSVIADVLSHELAHVARHDYLWSSICDMACGMLFFHPGIWQARKQMRIHREMACDQAVVSARPEHRADYAHTLTQVARLKLPRKYPAIGVDFAATPSLLRHRVEAILDESENGSAAKNFSRFVAGAALICVYALLCSALAVAIAFVPSERPRSVATTASPATAAVPVSAHKIKRSHTQPEEQSFIAESPAYRLPSGPSLSPYTPESNTSFGDHAADRLAANGGSRTVPPNSRRTTSVGSVESVIVSTVGTVLAGDKDDRNTSSGKKK